MVMANCVSFVLDFSTGASLHLPSTGFWGLLVWFDFVIKIISNRRANLGRFGFGFCRRVQQVFDGKLCKKSAVKNLTHISIALCTFGLLFRRVQDETSDQNIARFGTTRKGGRPRGTLHVKRNHLEQRVTFEEKDRDEKARTCPGATRTELNLPGLIIEAL